MKNSVDVFKIAEGKLAKADNIQVNHSPMITICGVKFENERFR